MRGRLLFGLIAGALFGAGLGAYAYQYPRWNGSLIGIADFNGEQFSSVNPLPVSGTYTSPAPTLTSGQTSSLQLDSASSLYVNGEGRLATYACSVIFDPAATATDAFTITGSATKTVRVRYVSINATSSANASTPVYLIKRSTADTGGTSTSPTVVPLDSQNTAGTATCRAYTVNPTLGTTVGVVRTTIQPFTSSASAIPPEIMRFGITHGDQSLVLRGTSQVLAINYAGVTIPSSAVLTVTVEWTEN
jgi:hypothetical protein